MTKSINRWILIRAFFLTALVFSFITEVCTIGGNSDHGEIESEKAPCISERALDGEAGKSFQNSLAEMRFSYERRKGFRGPVSKRNALESERAVYAIVEELKERIELPFDIQVVFEDCGGPDSFYDEETQRITICYELIDAYHDLFSRTLKVNTARDEAAKGAIVSMFLHEVAHALIHGWDLPITGREEDAADQFSTLLLINGIPNGEQLALEGARSFELLADLDKDLEKDYSDPHSRDDQRFFNTICLIYGHRPEQYDYLIRNGTIPVRSAYECEGVYTRAKRSWQTLLAPHLVRQNKRSFEFDALGFPRMFS